jgi:dihydropteroate synthase
LKDIIYMLSEKVEKLKQLGVNDIIIDPGFGFGKTVEHNYQLLKNLNCFDFFELPVLVGISRKSMINKVLQIKPADALNATSILNTIALLNGANILRVHDVKEAVEAIKLMEVYNQPDN